MDDLRRLLALHQRELECLQRQCDARAASARKSPSSPHLVQLRKLYNTLAKQRRHVEALEVLRTLESLEWREAESQREEAEQRNEAELEAMLQRHGEERQLLEQHLLRTQHSAGATDLASSWSPEPPAALLEPQHGLQHRHRRLRSLPPSLPCTAPHMLRRGASYEPEHNQQGPEDFPIACAATAELMFRHGVMVCSLYMNLQKDAAGSSMEVIGAQFGSQDHRRLAAQNAGSG
ncbi:hypothetical protein N2152v2_004211 [Parachlorella kessleri]